MISKIQVGGAAPAGCIKRGCPNCAGAVGCDRAAAYALQLMTRKENEYIPRGIRRGLLGRETGIEPIRDDKEKRVEKLKSEID